MKLHPIVFAVCLGFAVGCKKDEAPAPSPAPTTSPSASATASPSPTTMPSPTTSPSPSGMTGSVSMEQLAGKWSMEQDGKTLENSSFDLSADGNFSMSMTQGTETHSAKGTAKIEGDTLLLMLVETDGKAAEGNDESKIEKMKVSPDGKKLESEKGTMTLVKM